MVLNLRQAGKQPNAVLYAGNLAREAFMFVSIEVIHIHVIISRSYVNIHREVSLTEPNMILMRRPQFYEHYIQM